MQRLLLLFVILIPAAFAADPRPPNLENPVDYIAWVNAEYGKGVRDNAADLYRQVAERFVMHQATEDAIKDKKRSEWTEDDRKTIRAWADANIEAIGLLEQAAAKGDCYFELEPSESGALIDVRLPYLSGVRHTAKLMARRSYLDLLEGRTDPAMRDACVMIRTANHFQAQPHVITYLVGIAVRSLGYDLVLQIPANSGDNPDFAALLEKLRADDSVLRNPERQFAIEHVTYMDVAQRFLKDTDGDGKLDANSANAMFEGFADGAEIPMMRPMTFDEVLAEGDACYKRVRQWAGAPPNVVHQQDEQMREDFKSRGVSLAAIMIPSLGRVAKQYSICTVQRSTVRIVLGAYAFKARNGRWPRDLKEATADESPGVRKDPFSGKELVYMLEGDSFLLYSVGEDFTDDGGKRAASGKPWTRDEPCDAVLWPLSE